MKTCISSSGRKIKVKYFAISRSAEKKQEFRLSQKMYFLPGKISSSGILVQNFPTDNLTVVIIRK